PSLEELVLKMEVELPEVDFSFWYRTANPQSYKMNKSCAQYPDPFDLQLHNFYWQTLVNGNVTFQLYAAYLDKRAAVESPRGVVRILATANQIGNEFPATHCQLWYADHQEPILVLISEYISVWPRVWNIKPLLSYPHLLSCPIPDELPFQLHDATPRTVSLTAQVCDRASNSLRVHYNLQAVPNTINSQASESTLSFGVCIKAFQFPFVDVSQRLIEWFELQRLLGTSRIYAYEYDVLPAVQRVLDYYQSTGYLELRPLTMANGAPSLRHYLHSLIQNRLLVKRLNELIPFNDCFYRNMYRHDYMVNVDVDEVIMPLGELHNWQQVADAVLQNKTSKCPNGYNAMCFTNSQFSDHNDPDELFFLQNTMRLRNYSAQNQAIKCFHNARYSLTLHNHYTLQTLPGSCTFQFVDTSLAHMQHYFRKIKNATLREMVEDHSIAKYATELRAAVRQVLIKLDE
ncbi:hypothetical protein KR093_010393, partial [Drosophila rubida]